MGPEGNSGCCLRIFRIRKGHTYEGAWLEKYHQYALSISATTRQPDREGKLMEENIFSLPVRLS